MGKGYRVNFRLKMIYVGMILLFASVFVLMHYSFQRSRNLLIAQETGVITQYMNRNEMVLEDVTDSIRKISAASSTNKQVAADLNQSFEGNLYSSENIDRIRSVENTLTFYRNIFFDYRLHYIILGVDGTVYSVADGIDNTSYFGQQFAKEVGSQHWYQEFQETDEVSRWVTPCVYNNKGEFGKEGENFLVFVRRIRDYNSQRFLGMSFVSFPTENLSQILVPYEGSAMALFNKENQLIYHDGELEVSSILEEISSDKLDERMKDKNGNFHYDIDGVSYLLHYTNMAGTEWKLVNLVPVRQITQAVENLYRMISGLMILIALGACLICIAMYFYITSPLNRLIRKVSQVSIGGTRIGNDEVEKRFGKPVFGILEAEREISRMVDHIEKLSAETIKQKEIQQNLRFEMLRAQLNPHFLFNTLNTIKWSAMVSGAGNIANMIASLGILLENSMNRKEEEVALKEEIKVVSAWVEIKNWALKNRIQLYEEIPEELLDFPVIKFCLQPLVENAVLHGMEHVENGEIRIRAEKTDNKVIITIQDNGVGMEPDLLHQIMMEIDDDRKRRHVTGLGLYSIHELMKIKYGPEYGLRLESKVGVGTKVYVMFPCGEEKKEC